MIEQKESIFCLVYIYTVCSFFPLWLSPISFNLSEIMITPECLALLAITISEWAGICKTHSCSILATRHNAFVPLILVSRLLDGLADWIVCTIHWQSDWGISPTQLARAHNVSCPINHIQQFNNIIQCVNRAKACD